MAYDTFLRFNDFYRRYEGHFLADFGVISTFLEFLQISKVKLRPQNPEKNRLFEFWKFKSKNGWSYGQKCLGGNAGDEKDQLLAPPKNFSDFLKIRKLSLKISLLWPKIEVFRE